jgi:crossover junction endodeoxyribonuclease RuvC
MNYIGIDPGKHGAIAAITPTGLSVWPTPMIGKEYDIQVMSGLLGFSSEPCRAVIERVHAMPKQGRTSMLSIGYGAGLWHALLTVHHIGFSVVSAVTWQKMMLAGVNCDDRKRASILVAKRLFPGVSLRRTDACRVDDDGMADALLMAEYARRTGGQ